MAEGSRSRRSAGAHAPGRPAGPRPVTRLRLRPRRSVSARQALSAPPVLKRHGRRPGPGVSPEPRAAPAALRPPGVMSLLCVGGRGCVDAGRGRVVAPSPAAPRGGPRCALQGARVGSGVLAAAQTRACRVGAGADAVWAVVGAGSRAARARKGAGCGGRGPGLGVGTPPPAPSVRHTVPWDPWKLAAPSSPHPWGRREGRRRGGAAILGPKRHLHRGPRPGSRSAFGGGRPGATERCHPCTPRGSGWGQEQAWGNSAAGDLGRRGSQIGSPADAVGNSGPLGRGWVPLRPFPSPPPWAVWGGGRVPCSL